MGWTTEESEFYSRRGRRFSFIHKFRLALGPTKVKRLGSEADHSSSSRVLTVPGTKLLLPHTSSKHGI